MLNWVGKHPLRELTVFPEQLAEKFDPLNDLMKESTNSIWQRWPKNYPQSGLLFLGDNKEVLTHLLANEFRGKIDLIFIDPPFDSGADYVRKVQLRGATGVAKIDGETYTLGEQIQYTDIWANDNYLQFMYERLLLLNTLLADGGSIYVHCDTRKSHHLRCIMDEIFGAENFRNELFVRLSNPKNDAKNSFGVMHEIGLFYTKGDPKTFKSLRQDFEDEYIETEYKYEDKKGKYATSPLSSRQPTDPLYEWKGITKRWRASKETMIELERADLLQYTSSGVPRKKRYLETNGGKTIQDLWDDVGNYQSAEYSDYPTAKPIEYIWRIINTSSKPGDIILDCFLGSGTTVTVAQKLGRRWIGCDINRGSIQTTAKRLQTVIQEQIKETLKPKRIQYFDTDDTEAVLKACQLSFATYLINDYDLTIQHNELVNLVCEHMNIERIWTDTFFEGTQGNKLVKINSFGHSLTPLDLEAVKRELEARPDEDRSIVIVCLGKELASDAWLNNWNRLRQGNNAINHIEIIELRTDPKYGKFIAHQTAEAKVVITRFEDKVRVKVEDFISPTIIERLNTSDSLFKTQISDWRCFVDTILIDVDYNGEIFNIAIADVPKKKNDWVKGYYEISIPSRQTRVAVKIIDMLGEEVIVSQNL